VQYSGNGRHFRLKIKQHVSFNDPASRLSVYLGVVDKSNLVPLDARDIGEARVMH